jgi:hypothetical protein
MPDARYVSVYIDGFNFYHALDRLKKNHLKWLNYHLFSHSYLRKEERLRRVYLFSSLTYDPEKRIRHATYMAALRAQGVEVIESTFKKAKKYCRRFDRYCKFWEEKQNDVSISVQMLADAHDGATHRMILMTADTDQIPTISYLAKRFPDTLELPLVIPPGRKGEARDLGALFSKPVEAGEPRIAANLLPDTVITATGETIVRPKEYDPPQQEPQA